MLSMKIFSQSSVRQRKVGTTSCLLPAHYVNRINCKLKISVIDSGIGMDKDKLDSIFLRFEKATRRVSSVEASSGLSLAICKELAEGMLGDLTAVSSPGEGSIFTLTVPAVLMDVMLEEQEGGDRAPKFRRMGSANLNGDFALMSTQEMVDFQLNRPEEKTEVEMEFTPEHSGISTPSETVASPGKQRRRTDSPHLLVVEDDRLNSVILQKYLKKLKVTLCKEYRIAVWVVSSLCSTKTIHYWTVDV